MTAGSLQQTVLHDRHVELGARMVPFAGWEMPVQYGGVIEEHRAVREAVGVFDVSHMGQVRTAGPGALAFLQRLITNDIAAIPVGGAQYGLLCNPDGGVLDDLFSYRLADEEFLTVTNASNHSSDVAWLRQGTGGFEVELEDVADATAMLAVQGPAARGLVAGLAGGPLPERMTAAELEVCGSTVLVAGTGYTGEDGVELIMESGLAPSIWDELVAAGAVPCGLAARDTLRTDAGYHLYGNDLDSSRNPIEAGLGWACREETGFIGSDAVARAREEGTEQVLVAFEMTDRGIARSGNPVAGGGVVSSGTFSPTFERGIGMAYLPRDMAEPGTGIEVDVRGKLRPAEVRTRPLYRKAD